MFITVNTLRIENEKIYGTLKWVYNNCSVRIVFDGLHKEDLSLMFEYQFVNSDMATFNDNEKNIVLKENDHTIYISSGLKRKILIKALVELFAAAFAKADKE